MATHADRTAHGGILFGETASEAESLQPPGGAAFVSLSCPWRQGQVLAPPFNLSLAFCSPSSPIQMKPIPNPINCTILLQ